MLEFYRNIQEKMYFCAVPPNIEDYQTSSDAIVREGANVSLTCKATGSPKPNISWKRDDNSLISVNKTLSGEYILLHPWRATIIIKLQLSYCYNVTTLFGNSEL